MKAIKDRDWDYIRKQVPQLTVDAVLIEAGKILLIRRSTEPYKNHWALPGGFVELGETLEQAVSRELEEETGIRATPKTLLGAYSDPKRDPRGHTVSIAYIMSDPTGEPKPTDEAKEIKWFPLDKLPKNLAFDHEKIIEDSKKKIHF